MDRQAHSPSFLMVFLSTVITLPARDARSSSVNKSSFCSILRALEEVTLKEAALEEVAF